jgi:TonB family protein
VISFEEMRYPAIAQSARTEGDVVVAVTLDEKGNAIGASAVYGDTLLIPQSLANAQKWKFAPNEHKRAIIMYDFIIDGLCRRNTPESLFRFVHKNAVNKYFLQSMSAGIAIANRPNEA